VTTENSSGVTTRPRPKKAFPKFDARAGSAPPKSTTGMSVLPTVFMHIAPTPSRMHATRAIWNPVATASRNMLRAETRNPAMARGL